MHNHMHVCTCIYTHIHARTDTYIRTCAHTQAYVCTYTYIHARTYPHTHVRSVARQVFSRVFPAHHITGIAETQPISAPRAGTCDPVAEAPMTLLAVGTDDLLSPPLPNYGYGVRIMPPAELLGSYEDNDTPDMAHLAEKVCPAPQERTNHFNPLFRESSAEDSPKVALSEPPTHTTDDTISVSGASLDTVSAAGDMEIDPGITMHYGWLQKLGFKSGKWQRRYFVLEEKSPGNITLRYSTGTQRGIRGAVKTKALKGEINLAHMRSCGEVSPGMPLGTTAVARGVTPKGQFPPHCLQLLPRARKGNLKGGPGGGTAETRMYYLAAGSDAELKAWLHSISRALQVAHGTSGAKGAGNLPVAVGLAATLQRQQDPDQEHAADASDTIPASQ
eukprot:m.695369 g.695369  ORF g.695369 m.695369 type:complete len:390 (+) comp22888_c1_seq20:61-1230(+)